MTTHDHDHSTDHSTDLDAGLGTGHRLYGHLTGPAESWMGPPNDRGAIGPDPSYRCDRYPGDDSDNTDDGCHGGDGDVGRSHMPWEEPPTEPLAVPGTGPAARSLMRPPADLEREEEGRSSCLADDLADDLAGGGDAAGAPARVGAGSGDRGPRAGIRAMTKARDRRAARARDRRAAGEHRLARMQVRARARMAGRSLPRAHHSHRIAGPAGTGQGAAVGDAAVRGTDLRSEAVEFAVLIRRASAVEPTWRRRRNDAVCRESIGDYQLALRLLALRARGDVAMLGGHVGRAPYGYLSAPTGRAHPSSGRALVGLVVDRHTAHVVPRVFAWRVELGLGHAAIARRLADDPVWAPPPIRAGGEAGSWTAAVVRGMLANPRYTGRQLITLPVNGLRKLTPIVHPPLIGDEVFWRAHQPPPAAGRPGGEGSGGGDSGYPGAPPEGAVQDGHRWWHRDRWFFDHNGPRVIR